jgi:hypothetical protein
VTQRRDRQSAHQRVDPRARLAALSLLDRAFAAATDDEIQAMIDALPDDHRSEVARLSGVGFTEEPVATLRAAASRGRMNGTAEALATVLTDAALADCIEQLGDASDLPSPEQFLEVTPGLIERHGVAAVRLMMAATIAGEAPARVMLTDLLKHDETLALPAVAPSELSTVGARTLSPAEAAERDRVKSERAERKARQKLDAESKRQQSAAGRARYRP